MGRAEAQAEQEQQRASLAEERDVLTEERAGQERARAALAEERAQRLAARLRELGLADE